MNDGKDHAISSVRSVSERSQSVELTYRRFRCEMLTFRLADYLLC